MWFAKTAIDDPSPSERTFEDLVTSLYTAGLSVEARDGDLGSILLFAKVADQEMLLSAVYQSRFVLPPNFSTPMQPRHKPPDNTQDPGLPPRCMSSTAVVTDDALDPDGCGEAQGGVFADHGAGG